MKTKISIILVLFLVCFQYVSAQIRVCDGGLINFSGNTINDICASGDIYTHGVDNALINGIYSSVPQGYFGNKYSNTYTSSITGKSQAGFFNANSVTKIANTQTQYQFNLGYVGNKYSNSYTGSIAGKTQAGFFNTNSVTKISNTNVQHQFQLGYAGNKYSNSYTGSIAGKSQAGFFDQYKTTKISSSYPEYDSYLGFYGQYKNNPITLDKRPIIKTLKKSSGGSSSNNCPTPSRAQNMTAQINTSGVSPVIDISWTRARDISQQKIILYAPSITHISIEKTQEKYALENPEKNKLYMGAIMSYSSCGNISYSDTFEIRYNPEETTKLTIKYQDNKIFIQNTDTIKSYSKTKLTCQQESKQLSTSNIDQQFMATLLTIPSHKSFHCSLEYFDTNNVQQKSDIFVFQNTPITKLSPSAALEIIHNGATDTQTIWENTYFLQPQLSEEITYADTALLFTNTLGGIYMKDATYALEMFQRSGWIGSTKKADDTISVGDFITLNSFLQKKNDFQESLIDDITKNYTFSQDDIIHLTLESKRNFYVLEQIQSSNPANYNNILSCLTLKGCQDIKSYHSFMKDLPPIKVPSNKNFPLPVTDSPLTWETYISILYTTLGYQEYTNQAYTSAEYNQFIEILKQSVIQDDTFYKQKMDYFDVHRINISLLSSSLPPKLDKLTRKTVRVINEVYPKLHNKQRLFIILNDYLQKQ